MAITFEQAVSAQEFHVEGNCTRTIGPRGGKKEKSIVYRRNGKTQTWKTRPGEFRVPIKYGLKCCEQLWHYDRHQFHTSEDCPLLKTEGEVR